MFHCQSGPGHTWKELLEIMSYKTMIIIGQESHCGDVRHPSLLESGGLSGRHMLSELKDYKDIKEAYG